MRAAPALILLVLLRTAAASDTPIIDLIVKPAQLNVGEELTATVIYKWPSNWRPKGQPDPTAAFQSQFVTAFPPAQTTRTGEGEQRLFNVTILAQRSGAWAMPRLSWDFTGPNGSETIQGPEVIVQVGTEQAPAKLPASRPLWSKAETAAADQTSRWWMASSAALIVAVAAVLIFHRRKHFTPPATPIEVFRKETAHCAASGDGKEAGALLSLALRRFCGATWHFDGPGSTTRELSRWLRQQLQADEHHDVMHIVEELDGLRWGADDLPVSAIQGLLERSKKWVDGVHQRLQAEAEKLAAEKAGRKAS